MKFKSLLILPFLVISLQAASVSDLTFTLIGDIDGDGNMDVNEDIDGDGKLDFFNEDINGNGKLDVPECDGWEDPTVDLVGNGYPVSEDIDGDGKLDVNEDLDGDGKLDVAEDLNGNGILDVGEDLDGDGNLDVNEDLDGDGNLDVNEDFNGNGILDNYGWENCDLDGDGNLDVNEDLDVDGNLDVAEDVDGDGNLDVAEYFSYSVSDCYQNASGSLDIPSSYNGLPVTSIGNDAFAQCTSLNSITIPDSVTSIGRSAFWSCGLSTITIPNSVTSIEYGAFENCISLSNITIPDGLTSIVSNTFQNCASLTSAIIPDSVTSIENNAFFGCRSLSNITVPNSVTSIGNNAFNYCTSLTNITIHNGVTSLGDFAFSQCFSLTRITIPDSVTSIGVAAFFRNTSLARITIPDSVNLIGDRAFEYCTNLTSVTFKGDVPAFGTDVFAESNYATIYYDSSKSGWSDTAAGRPAYPDIFGELDPDFGDGGYSNPNANALTGQSYERLLWKDGKIFNLRTDTVQYDGANVNATFLRAHNTMGQLDQAVELMNPLDSRSNPWVGVSTIPYGITDDGYFVLKRESPWPSGGSYDNGEIVLLNEDNQKFCIFHSPLEIKVVNGELYRFPTYSTYDIIKYNSDGSSIIRNADFNMRYGITRYISYDNKLYLFNWTHSGSQQTEIRSVVFDNDMSSLSVFNQTTVSESGNVSWATAQLYNDTFETRDGFTSFNLIDVVLHQSFYDNEPFIYLFFSDGIRSPSGLFTNSSNVTLKKMSLDGTILESNVLACSDQITAPGFFEVDYKGNVYGFTGYNIYKFDNQMNLVNKSNWPFEVSGRPGYNTYRDNFLFDQKNENTELTHFYMSRNEVLYKIITSVDSDNDGIPDSDEDNSGSYISILATGTSPFNPDSDGDGLMDGYELVISKTSPLNDDSDGDGFKDKFEMENGYSPTSAGSKPDPNNADSDGDGLSDGVETIYGTDPYNADTDGDGLPDVIETNSGVFVSLTDTGTDPNNPDSLHTTPEMVAARTAGQQDVTGNPSQYGLFTDLDFNDALTSSRAEGQQDVISSPYDYGLMGAAGVFDMRISQPGISMNGDMASMNFTIQSSNNLEEWNNEETIRREYTMPSDKNFMRVSVGPQLEPEPLTTIATDTYGDKLVYDEFNNLYVNDENTPLIRSGVNLKTDTYPGWNFYAVESTSSGYLCLLKDANRNAIITLDLDGNFLDVSIIADPSVYEDDFGQSLD